MREMIKKIIYNLNYRIFMKNAILFESNPDFCDNTRAIFDCMIRRGLNKKYRLIWFVNDKKKFSDIKIKNVYFIEYKQKIKIMYYQFFAKYIFDCNRYIRKRNKNQFRIYLTHGTPLKLPKDYSSISGEMDYVVQISDYFTAYDELLFGIDKDKIITTGFPRNDILLNNNNNYIFFSSINRNKTICWFPTYRNHKSHSTGKGVFPFGMPTIKKLDDLERLNKLLKKESILLIIKFHPAEDLSLIMRFDFSNIKLIDDNMMVKEHLTIYHYLTNVDAIITDYSSLYYDFLLTDKPIGLAIPDVDEFSKNNQVIFENYEDSFAGEYIYSFDDLTKFITNVANNNDVAYARRMEKKKLYHKYFDGNASDRILKIFEDKNGD